MLFRSVCSAGRVSSAGVSSAGVLSAALVVWTGSGAGVSEKTEKRNNAENRKKPAAAMINIYFAVCFPFFFLPSAIIPSPGVYSPITLGPECVFFVLYLPHNKYPIPIPIQKPSSNAKTSQKTKAPGVTTPASASRPLSASVLGGVIIQIGRASCRERV